MTLEIDFHLKSVTCDVRMLLQEVQFPLHEPADFLLLVGGLDRREDRGAECQVEEEENH